MRTFLIVLNQIFEAGIAITALSLFVRSLSFNLRERVSRSFAVILACTMIVYSGEAISSAVHEESAMRFWMQFQWLGLVYFPAAYIHFSDALLETTGRPSRGRRNMLMRAGYIIATAFLTLLPLGYLNGELVASGQPFPYMSSTPAGKAFAVFYLICIILAASWMWRAYRRTRLLVSRRRFGYLQIGAFLLAMGTYPYLQLAPGLAGEYPSIFLFVVVLGNMSVFWFLVLMAYGVGFFGVPWPDRVIRSRLFKWLLRGPFTLFIVLMLMTVVQQVGINMGTEYSVAVPIVTVTSVLFFEHLITLVYPSLERLFFFGRDREKFESIQGLQDRLVSSGDLEQFLQTVLASVCDQFQVDTAFIASLKNDGGMTSLVHVGDVAILDAEHVDASILETVYENQQNRKLKIFAWGDFWVYPLYSTQQSDVLLGLLGVLKTEEHQIYEGLDESITLLSERAALALEDWQLQLKVFQAIEQLNPKVDYIQRLRAASRYNQREIMAEQHLPAAKDLSLWVKDALNHYWGGPKLTESPLMDLEVVQQSLDVQKESSVNVLRSILREAVEQVRPPGERRFTGEWILYNILEMKFMEGRKVREIALRLAMSEADLYRKQRIAIDVVADAIIEMERIAREN